MKTQIVVGARTSDVWKFRFDRFYRISVILSIWKKCGFSKKKESPFLASNGINKQEFSNIRAICETNFDLVLIEFSSLMYMLVWWKYFPHRTFMEHFPFNTHIIFWQNLWRKPKQVMINFADVSLPLVLVTFYILVSSLLLADLLTEILITQHKHFTDVAVSHLRYFRFFTLLTILYFLNLALHISVRVTYNRKPTTEISQALWWLRHD